MVYGVGIYDMPKGWMSANEWNKKVYRKWSSMLMRCYSEKSQERNPTYKECYVCERWLLLSNFVEDFPKINGYDEKKFLNNQLVLDKDIKSDNKNKCYCLEECLLVTNSENTKQANKYVDHSNEEYRRKISKALTGKQLSEETKRKISKTKKGKQLSEEAKQKMSINSSKRIKIVQYDKQGNLIKIWDCMMDVQRQLEINASHISECCKGKRKSAGGYIWKYYEED